jgi:hypothetical protein
MSPPVIYWVDARDYLVRVNEAWDVFAHENDAPDLVAERVTGRPIWDGIADAGTRHLYAALLPRVRAGATARFSLRCDSPTMRRRLHLTIGPDEAGLVRFESVVTAIEPRPEQPLLRRDLPRGLGVLTVCGWCKRVSVLDGWLELEDAVAQLRLFDVDLLPELSHGLCPDCSARVNAALAELG